MAVQGTKLAMEAAGKLEKAAKSAKVTEKIVDSAKYSMEYFKKLNGKEMAQWMQKRVSGFKDLKNYQIKVWVEPNTGMMMWEKEKIASNMVAIEGKQVAKGSSKATAPRTINLTSEMDTSGFGKLTFSGVIDAGRSGTTRPLVSTPNSYFKTKAGNIIVYDNEGKLLYDINNERVKIFDINVNPQGKEFLNPRKLDGIVPQEILNLLK